MIRTATVSDVPEMLEIYAPFIRTTTYTFEYEVPSVEDFSRRFAAVTEKLPWLVYEEDGHILGYAYASLPFERAAYRWCAEPSIYLAPQAQGRGVGKKLYEILENLLTQMGYRTMLAIITGENTRSIRFHQALGYTQCGLFHNVGLKFGRWLDVYWLEKQLHSVDIPSNFPTDWPLLRDNPQRMENYLGKMSLSESEKI